MIQLETYKGTKSRHTCPSCGHRNQFTRFVDGNGNYLSDDCGICNRQTKCGYSYTAKQYFADNPQAKNGQFKKGKRKSVSNYQVANLQLDTPSFDFIAPEHLKQTIGNYEKNAFVQFLLNLFPDCGDEIQSVLRRYFVGTYQDGLTVYWQIDRRGKIRTGKIMRYDAGSGKRQIIRTWIDKDGEERELKADWMHCKIKKDFNLKQCFFGEHLLYSLKSTKPVAIVESEKSAIIASLCFPNFVWLSIGSKQSLKVERLQKLAGRQIILYPDADGYNLWQSIAQDAQRQGLTVKVSRLIENYATDEQKAEGYDLADYLINQQNEINELNEFIDSYNSKVDLVLNDEKLKQDFETILDEQKSVLIINGGLSEIEAERICTQPENLQSIVLGV